MDFFKKKTSSTPQSDTPKTTGEVDNLLTPEEISKLQNKPQVNVDLSDIISDVKTDTKNTTTDQAKQQELEQKKLEQQAKKNAKVLINKSFSKQFGNLSPSTKLLYSNLFLVACIWLGLYLLTSFLLPTLKSIEIAKNDLKAIKSDQQTIEQNLAVFEESRPEAFTYRKLNDTLLQAIPNGEKYEDNIQIIIKLLKESITWYSQQQKLLKWLTIRPKIEVKNVQSFQLNNETLLGVEYNLAVEGFEKYEYVKNFLTTIKDRLRIFHIKDINITKVLNRETKKTELSVSIVMYSYYKIPKVDENGVRLDSILNDKTFN